MNKKFFIYIIFLVPILCASCDRFGESNKGDYKEVKNIEVFPDSVRQYLIEQDSLKRGLISKIDILTTELNTSKKEIEQLQSEINELKSPGRLFSFIILFSLLLSIIAIIMSVVRTQNKVDEWDVDDMKTKVDEQVIGMRKQINRVESKIKEFKDSSTTKSTPASTIMDKRILDLELRLCKIERNGPMESSHHPSYGNQTSSSNDLTRKEEPSRKEYAKANSGKFLVQLTDSQQEGCVYVINLTNKEEGKFDIISLAKIKSVNDIMDVIELAPGSCSIENATNCNVIERGLCKKVEGKPAWEVTKKLEIKVTE